jgi:hypothetical protein
MEEEGLWGVNQAKEESRKEKLRVVLARNALSSLGEPKPEVAKQQHEHIDVT